MQKQTKQFDNLKDAKIYMKLQKSKGKQVNLHPHKEHMSYKGINKTFYDVTSWE